jgi:hypothetical protein
MLKYWIWLAHTCKATEAEKVELLRQFGTPENIYNASDEQLSPFLKKAGLNRDLAEARQFQAVCEKKKLGILTFHDEAYPQRLKCIYNPPILLYYKGELPDFDRLATEYSDTLAVVAVHTAFDAASKAAAPDYVEQNFPNSKIYFAFDKAIGAYDDEYYTLMNGDGSYPTTFVIDERGVITKVKVGTMSYDELKNYIDAALAD